MIAETCTAVVAMSGGLDRMRAGLFIETPAGRIRCVWLCALPWSWLLPKRVLASRLCLPTDFLY